MNGEITPRVEHAPVDDPDTVRSAPSIGRHQYADLAPRLPVTAPTDPLEQYREEDLADSAYSMDRPFVEPMPTDSYDAIVDWISCAIELNPGHSQQTLEALGERAVEAGMYPATFHETARDGLNLFLQKQGRR